MNKTKKKTPPKNAFYLRRDNTSIRFVYNENGDDTVMLTRYEYGVEQPDIMGITHNYLNTQDARALWDDAVSRGFTRITELSL